MCPWYNTHHSLATPFCLTPTHLDKFFYVVHLSFLCRYRVTHTHTLANTTCLECRLIPSPRPVTQHSAMQTAGTGALSDKNSDTWTKKKLLKSEYFIYYREREGKREQLEMWCRLFIVSCFMFIWGGWSKLNKATQLSKQWQINLVVLEAMRTSSTWALTQFSRLCETSEHS